MGCRHHDILLRAGRLSPLAATYQIWSTFRPISYYCDSSGKATTRERREAGSGRIHRYTEGAIPL